MTGKESRPPFRSASLPVNLPNNQIRNDFDPLLFLSVVVSTEEGGIQTSV